MKIYAVLTGDLIGSRELAPAELEHAMGRVRRLAGEFGEVHPGAVVGQPDVFRGDSWQWCLQEPALAVTAAVFLRAGLKSEEVDTRVGIGIGTVTKLHDDRISESTGPAFIASGEVLDGLEKERALGVGWAAEATPPSWAAALGMWLAPLLDLQIGHWTQREAVAVYGTLRKLTQQMIAGLPAARTREGSAPTRQAVQDALRRIGWAGHLEPALTSVEKLIRSQVS